MYITFHLILVIFSLSDPKIENYLQIDEERLGDVKPGFPIYHKTARVLCIRCKVS